MRNVGVIVSKKSEKEKVNGRVIRCGQSVRVGLILIFFIDSLGIFADC